jgi:hypothetical protein
MLDHHSLQVEEIPQGSEGTQWWHQNQLQCRGGSNKPYGQVQVDQRMTHPRGDSQYFFHAWAREEASDHLQQLVGVLQGTHAEWNCQVLQGQAGTALY